MSETQLISMRMPVDLVAKVDGLAEAQGRSRANVILRALEVGLGKQAVAEILPSSEVVQAPKREPVQSASPMTSEREVIKAAREDSGHNTETCRIYRCFACQAIKERRLKG